MNSGGKKRRNSFTREQELAIVRFACRKGASEKARNCLYKYLYAQFKGLIRIKVSDAKHRRLLLEDEVESVMSDFFLFDFRERGLAGHVVGKMLIQDVRRLIESGDSATLLKRMEYTNTFKLRLSKRELIGILDAIAASPVRESGEGQQAFDVARRLVRSSN